MERLRHRELKLFSKSLVRLYDMSEPERIHEQLVDCVASLTSGDFICCEVVDPTNDVHQITSNVQVPNHEAWVRRLGELVHQNPIIPFVMNGGGTEVLSPYDLMPKKEFERTELFNEAFRVVGEQQLAAMIPKAGAAMATVIHRNTTFSEEDRTLLKLLRPHLMQAYSTAQLTMRLRQRDISVKSPADLLKCGLSSREIEVLHWMREGKADKEIGIILGISHRTVNNHVAAILRKLGVDSRMAAVVMTFGCS
ncbi:hypothetical protein DB346_15205 [Verrucomicrobia bacterium LW23]|nr:hypothetical protein DB346_15205 [Verrucomicrobia bacterium LW23]